MKKINLIPSILFFSYCIYSFIIDWIYILFERRPDISKFVNDCIISPIWEEAVYRYAPIEICKVLDKKLLKPVIIATSLLFGFGHDGDIFNIYFQGIFGIVLSVIYLNSKHPFITTVFFHGLWNFMIDYIVKQK